MAREENGCGNCGAFVPEDHGGGLCKRHPPMAQMEGAMSDETGYAVVWPWVHASDWCYQWVPEQGGRVEEVEAITEEEEKGGTE